MKLCYDLSSLAKWNHTQNMENVEEKYEFIISTMILYTIALPKTIKLYLT